MQSIGSDKLDKLERIKVSKLSVHLPQLLIPGLFQYRNKVRYLYLYDYVILNQNVPAAYLFPAETYECLMDKLEDAELAESSAIRTRL